MSSTQAQEEEEKSNSSDEDNESSTNSSSLKNSLNKKSNSEDKIINDNSNKIENENNASGIIEVYEDNFLQEMKNLSLLVKEYNYIGMDTEFPGIVYSLSSLTDDFYYKSLKLNVDSLKLIQVGITLSNEKGEYPKPIRTWQFNLEFDITKDKSSQSSMLLLISSGIDFKKMKKCGINQKKFVQQFQKLGLVLNPDIHWISFHGGYDFAYLLKYLIGNPLPNNEKEFTKLLGLFFPNHYDIRILIKDKSDLKGSLNKLASYLDVEREGKVHQAGSDSLVTIEVFWKLIKEGYITKEDILEDKNILYGILKGKDNKETINYTKINYRSNKTNKINNTYNGNYTLNNNINNLNANMPYMAYGNNIYNMCMNYCYPQMIVNGLYNNMGYNGIQMVNNRNNIVQYC
jgi:CCR4-NOT transcription complex subunit 7/8